MRPYQMKLRFLPLLLLAACTGPTEQELAFMAIQAQPMMLLLLIGTLMLSLYLYNKAGLKAEYNFKLQIIGFSAILLAAIILPPLFGFKSGGFGSLLLASITTGSMLAILPALIMLLILKYFAINKQPSKLNYVPISIATIFTIVFLYPAITGSSFFLSSLLLQATFLLITPPAFLLVKNPWSLLVFPLAFAALYYWDYKIAKK